MSDFKEEWKDPEYIEGLDKRKKEYKDYKAWKDSQEESVGLGDVVEKITEATGIKRVVKWLFGENCGCEQRKDDLNQIQIIKKKRKELNKHFWLKYPNFMTQEDFDIIAPIIEDEKRNRYYADEVVQIYRVYNFIFGRRDEVSTCSSCVSKKIKELRKYMDFCYGG
jgi:hypothetical protein